MSIMWDIYGYLWFAIIVWGLAAAFGRNKKFSFASYIMLFPACYFFTHFPSEDSKHRKYLRIIYSVAAVMFIFLILMYTYKSHQIGNFFEAPHYESEYYVMASRSDGKFYKLPAEIAHSLDTSKPEYKIKRAFFSNGGFLYFDSDFWLTPGLEWRLTDQNSEEWRVVLTTEPVSASNPATVHSHIDNIRIICYIAGLIYTLWVLKHSQKFSFAYFEQCIYGRYSNSYQIEAIMKRYAESLEGDLEGLISQMNEKADAANVEPAPLNYSAPSAAIYRYSKVCENSINNMLNIMQDKSDEAGTPPLPFDVTIFN